jgi:CSLREA domain-containing protein
MIGKKQYLRICLLAACLLGLFVGSAALAATITVNSLADPGQAGVCALRDAITAANTMTATNGCTAGSGNDTINFSPRMTGTISLVSTLPEVTDSLLTINGPASQGITISGGGSIVPLQVMEVAASATLNLNNLSIAHGFPLIGVAAGATLNLNKVSIADGFGFGLSGGGIDNAGTLTVTNSIFSDNGSQGGGGGISNRGVLTVTGSMFSSGGGEGGGGIDNEVGATSTVTNSTFSANTNSHGVGAVFNAGTLTVINSTFFGNRCMHSCPGAISNAGILTVTNSTFSGNMGDPGGIGNFLGLGSVSFKSTILANSMAPPPPVGLPSDNCFGAITDTGYNISDDSSCGFAKTGSANNGDGVNPLLSTAGLANNGGPTETIALQSGSPATDAIPVADCMDQASPPNLITDDQREFPRPDAGERVCDIGAYESESFAGQPGARSCQSTSVAVLTEQFGSLDAAASALGFSSVNALQSAIQAFCKG